MKHILSTLLLVCSIGCAKVTAGTVATNNAINEKVDGLVTHIEHAPPSSGPRRVGIITEDGHRFGVQVEVVSTPAQRERGLMFRKFLDPEAGMLFVFDDDQDHSFWMRNTLIPLDMIFISSEGVIVGIVADATPETETLRAAHHANRYVLETNAGWAALKGVKVGDRVDLSAALPP